MKTRNGWVSNSSSSSFLLVGVDMEDENLFTEGEFDKIRNDYYDELVEDLFWREDDNGGSYLGIEPATEDNNRTILSFKEQAKKALDRYLKKDIPIDKIHFFYGSSYDG